MASAVRAGEGCAVEPGSTLVSGDGVGTPTPPAGGTVRKPLVGWAAALLPLVGFIVLVDFAVWTDALRTILPAFGRDGAPVGFFVVTASGLIGLVLLLGTLAYGETYFATLLTTATLIPSLVAVAVLLIYLSTSSTEVLHGHALYLGSLAAFAVWALGAPLMGWLASADTAQGRSYGELLYRAKNLCRRLEALDGRPSSVPPAGSIADSHAPAADTTPEDRPRASTISQVRAYVEDLEKDLGLGGDPAVGLRFALGTGYVNLWREVHRAEELLLELESTPAVIAGATYDELRLKGSRIPNRDELLKRLSAAAAQFGPMAAVGFGSVRTGSLVEGNEQAQGVARAVLREVRASINAYRDNEWEGYIRERNRLLRTIFITSTATLLFVILGVVYHVGRGPFAAAAAFYLVGSTVGLFARLRSEGIAGAAVDDYGLFEARLLHIPLLSGLAGVAGVFVLAVAPSILGTNAAADQAATVSLAQVFDLGKNTRGLIAAGVFGLAPELLTRWLGKQADTIKDQLEASQPAGASKTGAKNGTETPADGGAASAPDTSSGKPDKTG